MTGRSRRRSGAGPCRECRLPRLGSRPIPGHLSTPPARPTARPCRATPASRPRKGPARARPVATKRNCRPRQRRPGKVVAGHGVMGHDVMGDGAATDPELLAHCFDRPLADHPSADPPDRPGVAADGGRGNAAPPPRLPCRCTQPEPARPLRSVARCPPGAVQRAPQGPGAALARPWMPRAAQSCPSDPGEATGRLRPVIRAVDHAQVHL